MSKSSENIVLVGAGSGGYLAYRELSVKLANTNKKLIVIEPRKFYVHLPSTLRMVVTPEGGLENKSIMDHPSNVNAGNTKFIYAKVTSIVDSDGEGKYVTLDNGETVEFAVLILATGGRWSGATAFGDKKEEVLKSVYSWRDRFRDAKDIVLIGGGAVGFELAGEIKDEWPDKRVTIIHRQSLPLNSRYPDRWRKDVTRRVEKRGIKLILNDSVENIEPKNGYIVTREGVSIAADLVIPTFGARPNTEFIKESLGPDVLSSEGYVKVKPTLQLVEHPTVFALGDIIEWKEEKQAIKAGAHASIVVNNVLAVTGTTPKFKEYKGSVEMIGLTNGKNGGSTYLGILWGIILGDWLTRLLKSKTLMIDMTRKSMGL